MQCLCWIAGAIYTSENSQVAIVDSLLESNYVMHFEEESHGGGAYINGTSVLTLNNTQIRNNSADYNGGGVAMGSKR